MTHNFNVVNRLQAWSFPLLNLTGGQILLFYCGPLPSGRVDYMMTKPRSSHRASAKRPGPRSLCGVNSTDDDNVVINSLADLFLDYLLSRHASKARTGDVHIDKTRNRS